MVKYETDNIQSILTMSPETYKQEVDYSRTIGAIELGTYTLTILRRKEGGYLLRPIKSSRRDFLHERVKDLAPSAMSSFEGLEPDLLEIVEVGLMPPQTNWRSGRGVLEEPQVAISGKDAFEFTPEKVTFFDEEIIDMFTKPVGGKEFKAASLFSMNTADGDIMGIALRRNTPVLILITPSVDGSNMNSKEGLNMLLGGIATGLSSKMSTFKADILSALADANSEAYFQFPYDSNTLAGSLQNNLLLQIYTIKTLFLAHNAENSGKGINDSVLLEHFPYLKTRSVGGKKGGIGGLFAQATQAKKLKIEAELWTSLVQDASKGISLRNPNDRTPKASKVKPLDQRGLHLIAPRVMSEADVRAAKAAATSQVSEVKPAITTVDLKTRAESVSLAQKPLDQLKNSLGQLATTRSDRLSPQDMSACLSRLDRVKLEFQTFVSKKKRGMPPVIHTQIDLATKKSTLKCFGYPSDKIFDFFQVISTGKYDNVIDSETQKWLADSKYEEVSQRSNRVARLASSLRTSARLAPLAEHFRKALNLPDINKLVGEIDLVQASYFILAEKTMYSLMVAGEQLIQTGQEVEINNWAGYSHAVIERLIKLGNDIK